MTGESAGAPDGTQLGILLAATTAAVDEQFRRADRLDSKARGQLTIVGAYFAFVQTIAAKVLSDLTGQDKVMAWTLLAVTVITAGCLFGALVSSSFAWKLRKERALNPDDLSGWVRYAQAGNPQVAIKLTHELAEIHRSRLDANQSRSEALRTATTWVICAAGLITIELILALVFTVI